MWGWWRGGAIARDRFRGSLKLVGSRSAGKSGRDFGGESCGLVGLRGFDWCLVRDSTDGVPRIVKVRNFRFFGGFRMLGMPQFRIFLMMAC